MPADAGKGSRRPSREQETGQGPQPSELTGRHAPSRYKKAEQAETCPALIRDEKSLVHCCRLLAAAASAEAGQSQQAQCGRGRLGSRLQRQIRDRHAAASRHTGIFDGGDQHAIG